MYSKSDSIELMINDKKDDVIEEWNSHIKS